ncbi:MAG: SUF system Fe-S cluster assembly regulator [Planctomycetes bacterium]|nr:SUF system Fe-S cluster assembly regulator [Planctomycetota bacterium]
MLRITKQTDYGIVLLTHFGLADEGQLLSAKELAERTRIPAPMVAKILKILVRAGLLDSQRGAAGGYGLARPARDLSLLEMIAALEGPVSMTECAEMGSGCPIEAGCRPRVNWKLINQVVQAALEGITLERMITPAPACATLDLGLVRAGLEAPQRT